MTPSVGDTGTPCLTSHSTSCMTDWERLRTPWLLPSLLPRRGREKVPDRFWGPEVGSKMYKKIFVLILPWEWQIFYPSMNSRKSLCRSPNNPKWFDQQAALSSQPADPQMYPANAAAIEQRRTTPEKPVLFIILFISHKQLTGNPLRRFWRTWNICRIRQW